MTSPSCFWNFDLIHRQAHSSPTWTTEECTRAREILNTRCNSEERWWGSACLNTARFVPFYLTLSSSFSFSFSFSFLFPLLSSNTMIWCYKLKELGVVIKTNVCSWGWDCSISQVFIKQLLSSLPLLHHHRVLIFHAEQQIHNALLLQQSNQYNC